MEDKEKCNRENKFSQEKRFYEKLTIFRLKELGFSLVVFNRKQTTTDNQKDSANIRIVKR